MRIEMAGEDVDEALAKLPENLQSIMKDAHSRAQELAPVMALHVFVDGPEAVAFAAYMAGFIAGMNARLDAAN